jgi:predicted nuclease of restriction endonuclease-like (RecB) superfamily
MKLIYKQSEGNRNFKNLAKAEKWGSKTIERLSSDLQTELKGLRGFSFPNLKRMRQFYEAWSSLLQVNSWIFTDSLSDRSQLKISENIISSLAISQLENLSNKIGSLEISHLENCFINVSFTAHCEIIMKVKHLDARIFYITKAAHEFWTVEILKHHLTNKLYEKQALFPNNFEKTITIPDNKAKALTAFRDHYLLDFVRISDEDADDEKLLENEIVGNIKKFLMSLGTDFTFVANQYRLVVEDEEYFIDLLFFNRTLQALVAFELKTGKFKPEFMGKMNFYLTVLDEYVKKTHENPSIGIILCKEKKNKIVEFSFRNYNNAMGVATYTTSNKLPEKYVNILPDEKALKKLME